MGTEEIKRALGERVKELRCLAAISSLNSETDSLEELLGQAVKLLPPAWQYPEDTVARITYKDQVFQTADWPSDVSVQTTELLVRGETVGSIEVAYLQTHPPSDEGPFLVEERNLLTMIGQRLALVVEGFLSSEALRRSEERYRTLAENTLDVVWSMNLDFEFTYVNPAVETVTGFTPQQLVGAHLRNFCSPEVFSDLEELVESEITKGEAHQGVITEVEVLHSAGGQVLLEVNARILFDDRGHPIGIQGCSRDLSERNLALRALKEREEQYRFLFESMMDGAVYQNRDSEIISANPAAERILGIPLKDLKSRTSEDTRWQALKEDGTPFPGPEHPAMVALRTGQKVTNVVMGIYNPTEEQRRWIVVNAMPQFTLGEPKPYRVYTTFRDITELRRIEAERSAAKERNEELLENIRDGFLALDKDRKIAYFNSAAETLLGKKREEVHLRPILAVLPEFHGSILEDKYRQALSTKDKISFETHCLEEWFDVNLHPNSDGGVSIFFQAITERKKREEEHRKLEEQYRQAQKLEAVGRLAGGVAHDFNNMLSVILGNAEEGLSKVTASHPVHQELQEIMEAGRRSADLTRQLLAFARKQTVRPKVLDLNDSIAGTLSMLRRLIGEDIELVWKPGLNLSPVNLDPSQLDQILANLVVNARDAMDKGGSIVIRTGMAKQCPLSPDRESGPQVVLTVSDSGYGMDEETIFNIFEPFFTTKGEGRGTGLGLSTVHGIVEQNGGKIQVESESGKGAVFSIYLPAVSIEKDKATTAYAPEAPSTQGETILLVEDEPSLLRLASRQLKGLGYQVLAAPTPGEALTLSEQHSDKIDLLLTDVVMPQMNGVQLRQQIEQYCPGLRCVFMSGYTSDTVARSGLNKDGVQFLQKPFTREELANKLSQTLSCIEP